MKIPITSLEQKTRAAQDGQSNTSFPDYGYHFKLPDDPEQRAKLLETIAAMQTIVSAMPPIVPISTRPVRYVVPKSNPETHPSENAINELLPELFRNTQPK